MISYQLASDESYGFFDDITDDEWRFKKRISANRIHLGSTNTSLVRIYYQSNWNPDFVCSESEMLGQIGFGGHWVCDPWRLNKDGCLVMNIGSASAAKNNFTFEGALKAKAPLCDIHVFDHVDYSHLVPPGEVLTFHQIGLQGSDFTKGNGETKTQTLLDLVQQTGASKKIDFLRLDCGGCEWSMFEDLQKVDIRQMAFMAHHLHHLPSPSRKDVSYSPVKTAQVFQHLHDLGYVIYHKVRFSACPLDDLLFVIEHGITKVFCPFRA
jgi:hypothetical protein